MSRKLQLFSGQIYKIGLIRYVDVPRKVSRSLGAKEVHVAVRGTVQGVPVVTTLVSRGNGTHRIAIHGEIRKQLRVDAGAIVEIGIERDVESREPLVPPALRIALRESPKAQAVFQGMTVSLRRQIVRYLTEAKQQATRERRVATFVQRIEEMPLKKRANKKEE